MYGIDGIVKWKPCCQVKGWSWASVSNNIYADGMHVRPSYIYISPEFIINTSTCQHPGSNFFIILSPWNEMRNLIGYLRFVCLFFVLFFRVLRLGWGWGWGVGIMISTYVASIYATTETQHKHTATFIRWNRHSIPQEILFHIRHMIIFNWVLLIPSKDFFPSQILFWLVWNQVLQASKALPMLCI